MHLKHATCVVAALVAGSVYLTRAQVVINPTVALCYATDGVSVSTTFVDGGAQYLYPAPSTTRIEQVDGGMIVSHETAWLRWTDRVYLPSVSSTP
jgi:hypothetical protein